MFRCAECKGVFDTPSEEKENVGTCGLAPAYEKIPVCVYCGSDEIERVSQCEITGEYISWGDSFSEDVIAETVNSLLEIRDGIQRRYGVESEIAQNLVCEAMERTKWL